MSAAGTIDDMIVDGLRRAYVGDLGFRFPPPPDRGVVGRILLVMPDAARAWSAEGLRFPNGIAVSADHKPMVVPRWIATASRAIIDIELRHPPVAFASVDSQAMKSPDRVCLDCEGAVSSRNLPR